MQVYLNEMQALALNLASEQVKNSQLNLDNTIRQIALEMRVDLDMFELQVDVTPLGLLFRQRVAQPLGAAAKEVKPKAALPFKKTNRKI